LGTDDDTCLRLNLPSNATIEKATLKLFVDGPANPATRGFDVYEIDTAWSEKTLTVFERRSKRSSRKPGKWTFQRSRL
jgi:hypothetical protein